MFRWRGNLKTTCLKFSLNIGETLYVCWLIVADWSKQQLRCLPRSYGLSSHLFIIHIFAKYHWDHWPELFKMCACVCEERSKVAGRLWSQQLSDRADIYLMVRWWWLSSDLIPISRFRIWQPQKRKGKLAHRKRVWAIEFSWGWGCCNMLYVDYKGLLTHN